MPNNVICVFFFFFFTITRYRHRAATLNSLTHPALNIARIVMGRRLVTFIIQNYYKCARFIPYLILAVTKRKNGCLGTEKDGSTTWLSDCLPDELVPESAEEMRTHLPMIDLNELEYTLGNGVSTGKRLRVLKSRKRSSRRRRLKDSKQMKRQMLS